MIRRFFVVVIFAFLTSIAADSAVAVGDEAVGSALSLEMTAKVKSSELLLLRAAHFDPTDRIPVDVGLGLSDWHDQNHGRVLAVVQFTSTPTAESRRVLLNRAGIEYFYYLPNNAYLVRLDLADLPAVSGLDGVRAAFRLPKWARVEPGLLDSPVDSSGRVAVEITAAPGCDALGIAAALEKRIEDIRLVTTSYHHEGGRVIARVRFGELHRAVDLLSGLEDVLSVDRWHEKQLLNNHSIWVGQTYDTLNTTNYAITAKIWNRGLLGAGQTVCVNDSGLDSDMCFFRYDESPASKTVPQSLLPPDIGTVEPDKKVVAYYLEPGADAYDSSQVHHHGTHVTGSVAGDNHLNLSAGLDHGHDNADGMAPQAKIVIQDVADSSGSLVGLAGDLSAMFQQAYDAGARIHSDSWGNSSGVYDGTALDMDEFMFRNQDFLFVVSMGNSGTAPGDSSIGTPAVAKGVVSVGGTTNGGTGADSLMPYSRGPTDDGRLKPDVVAPGSLIESASGSSSNNDNNCSSKSLSGTSMATPTTSGFLALLRQYYIDGFYPSGSSTAADGRIPSGALMKATLITGAMPLGGIDHVSGGPVSTIPSLDQGWGRTHLDNSLFFSGDSRQIRVWDVRHEAGIATGEQVDYTLALPIGTEPLEVRLVWSDPESTTLAAVNLVNNLDLEVTSPSGVLYIGNNFADGSSATGGFADVLNPVEGVRIPSPAAGSWTLRIKGTAVPGTGTALYSDRQGYALVATFGRCLSFPAAPIGLSATSTPPAGINLTWSHPGAAGFLIYRAPGSSPAPGDYSLVGSSSLTSFTDEDVQGGYTYSYATRATDGCAESGASGHASVTFTGSCSLYPGFEGLGAVSNDLNSPFCDLVLEWGSGASNCPFGPGLIHNVYRGSNPYFTPSVGNLVASVAGTGYTDSNIRIDPFETYYYVVRAEDSTSGHGGPSNGGNEEQNTVVLSATAWGPTTSPGTFVDDGGDSNAKLSLEGEWRVTNQENHTQGGGFSYHSAPDGSNHGPGQCAAATTPPMALQPGSPQLTYWASYNIEAGWDGVVVEVNDCNPDCDTGSWTVSDPSGGYPGSFMYTGSPPVVNACAYPSGQGCFNGPVGNSALSGWSQYSHDLSSWAGQTVQLRWNFSSDPAFEVDGFYLDDIEVTLASVNDSCWITAGRIQLDREFYRCRDTLNVSLVDSDLTGQPDHDVTVASDSEPAGETLTLLETAPSLGTFMASINTTSSPAAADGLLSVADGNTITVTYVDADDGLGGSGVAKTDIAIVDCQGPEISNVQVADLVGTSVTVLWDTDEDANSLVTHGPASAPPPAVTTNGNTFGNVHQVEVAGLSECTDYSFFVTSTDPAGNQMVDDASSAYYGFSTPLATNITYDSLDTPQAISDSTTVSSTLTVSTDRMIVDVDVQIDITHTYDGDLDVYLISPGGMRIELTTDNGGSGDNFDGTIFDDEASIPITGGASPFTGSFQPEGVLAAIDGQAATGDWQLEISDDEPGYIGTLNWWRLTFTFPFQTCGPDASYSVHSTVTDSCGLPFVGDGIWDPGENAGFNLTLSNSGTAALSNVSANVTAQTAGATMTIVGAFFGSIPPQASVQSQSSYLVELPPAVACGSTIDFQVEITSDQGSFQDTFSHAIGDTVTDSFTLLSQNFEGPWGPGGDNPPTGWSVLDFGDEDSPTWNDNDWHHFSKGPPWGDVARVYYSPVENQDEHLLSPAFTIPAAASVDLIYDHYFHAYSIDDFGVVDVTSDQLGGWTNLVTYSTTDSANMAHEVISLQAFAGHSNVVIRFRYLGNNDWYWEVDNVEVSGTQPGACRTAPCNGSQLPFVDGFESGDISAWSIADKTSARAFYGTSAPESYERRFPER